MLASRNANWRQGRWRRIRARCHHALYGFDRSIDGRSIRADGTAQVLNLNLRPVTHARGPAIAVQPGRERDRENIRRVLAVAVARELPNLGSVSAAQQTSVGGSDILHGHSI
jgi:hypothetical protein